MISALIRLDSWLTEALTDSAIVQVGDRACELEEIRPGGLFRNAHWHEMGKKWHGDAAPRDQISIESS